MKLAKSFSSYTLISFINAGIPFFLLPVLTHYLSPEDYGFIGLFSTYLAILVPFTSLGTNGYISLEFTKKSSKGFQDLFSSVFKIPFLATLAFVILGVLSGGFLENILELPFRIILLLPILALLAYCFETLTSLLIFQKKILLFGIVSISKTVMEVLLTLFFIVQLKMDWIGRINSLTITSIVLFVISIVYFVRMNWLDLKSFNKKRIKQSLIYGIPLIPHILGKFVINQSDQLFIAKMASVEELGIYRTGYQFGLIISIASGAFLSVYTPFLFERLKKVTEEKKKEIVRLSYQFLFGLTILTILVSLISPLIFNWLIHPDYHDGIVYVFWTALSYLFWGGYLVFAGYLYYFKKTKILGILAVINVFLNLALNYLLIQKFNVIGVSYATAISFLIVFLATAIISNRIIQMPWISFFKSNK